MKTKTKKAKSEAQKKRARKPEQGKAYKQEDIIVPMYNDGMSAGEIARKFDVSRGVILHFLKKFDVDVSKSRKVKSPNAKEDYKKKTWLTNQLKKGISIFAIAKDCKVSYATAHNQAMKLVDARVIEEGRKVRKQKKQKPKTTGKKSTEKISLV